MLVCLLQWLKTVLYLERLRFNTRAFFFFFLQTATLQSFQRQYVQLPTGFIWILFCRTKDERSLHRHRAPMDQGSLCGRWRDLMMLMMNTQVKRSMCLFVTFMDATVYALLTLCNVPYHLFNPFYTFYGIALDKREWISANLFCYI